MAAVGAVLIACCWRACMCWCVQVAQSAAAGSSLAAPPPAAAVAAAQASAASGVAQGRHDSNGYAAAGVSMLGALAGCSQVLPADTPLGGGVVLGCHYQVLQKPWLPLDTAVRQFKVHLSLMATKARLHQQQQQHAGPNQQLLPPPPPQQQQQHEQQRPVSVQPPEPPAEPTQQQALEQPLLLRQHSDSSSSSNPSNQQLLPGPPQPPLASVHPPHLLHVVACEDEEGSDSSLGPGTAVQSSLAQQAWLEKQQRQRIGLA